MLVPNSSRFQFAGGPVKLLGQAQTRFAWNGSKCSYLFRTELLAGKHETRVVENAGSSKARAGNKSEEGRRIIRLLRWYQTLP